jgi:hypothetical protein
LQYDLVTKAMTTAVFFCELVIRLGAAF